MEKMMWRSIAVVLAIGICVQAESQRRPIEVPGTTQANGPQQRQRLILKDGTYQIVMSYVVAGNVVRYRSAERNGETEEIPLKLVDLAATERWKKDHGPGAAEAPPVLSPELAEEEASRAALTPEILPDLRLPDQFAVLALDTFRGISELVPLPQFGSDLNHETAHAVQKLALKPQAAPHRILDVQGFRADVQLHVADPVFYVRVGADEADVTGAALIVDTHDISSLNARPTPGGGSPDSGYVLERLNVRSDVRQLDSFRLPQLGTGRPQPDVIEMKHEPLPGGHWIKLTPVAPLDFGEYALVETLSDRELNLDVWEFGVHSDARENVEAIRPEPKKPVRLQKRP